MGEMEHFEVTPSFLSGLDTFLSVLYTGVSNLLFYCVFLYFSAVP